MADSNKPTTVASPAGAARIELAQATPTPIEVPRPQAGQVVTVAVEKGRPLKLAFALDDVQSRTVEGDDLILAFADGGKVALKGYISTFGAGDPRFVVVQADGKSYAASELLEPGAPAGRRPPPKTAAADADYVIVNKPQPNEIVVVKLDPKKQPALNFGIRDVAGTAMDGDTLVVRFKDGGTIRFENYKQYAETPGTKFSFGKSAEIPATSVPKAFEASPGGRPDEAGPGGPGSHPFDTPFDPGKLGPGLDHLNGLPGVDFLDPPLGGPDGSPGPPGGPPPGGGGGGGPGGDTPLWFLNGPAAVAEAANANNVLGLNFLNLAPGQTRSIDLKLVGVGIAGKAAALPADIDPGAAALVAKLQGEIAAAVAAAVPPGSIVAINLVDGVRIVFADNAPLQLPFKLTALADLLIEGGETYRLDISNPLSQAGAVAAQIQAGKDKVETEILDQTKGNWELTGDAAVIEGAPAAPKYTLALTGADLVNGQTASVVVKAVFAGGAGNATPANAAGNNADRDFSEAFFKDLQDALGATPGVTLQDLGNNMVRITLSDTAAQTLTFALPTLDDPNLEPDEKFRIEIADASANTQLSANPALRAVDTTILDNEAIVWRIDGPATVNEGDQHTVLYTVSYVGNPAGPVSIKLDIDLPGGIGGAEAADFAAQLNTAVALGIDIDGPGGNPPIPGVTYDPATQTLTLAPTVKSFTFFIPTLDDALVERPEAFAIKIQNPSEGRVEQDKVVTVILDNDAPPVPEPRTFELTGDKEVSEGNPAKYWIELKGPPLAGAETASVTLRIDTTGLPQPATLPGNPNPDFAQTLLQAIGNQLAGVPGIAFATVDPSGAQITIQYGAATPRQLMFTLPTLEDATVEGDERYRIFVANTSPGASVAPGKGEVVTAILDDDRPAGAVAWAIGGTDVVLEGGTPSYTVVRTGDPIAPGTTQAVEISLAYPGGNFGALPADFAEALLKDIQDSLVPGIAAGLSPNGNIRLTFDATAPREFTFTLPTLDDATPENTEVFAVSLVNQSTGTIPLGQGIVETRILDNDFPAPNVLIGDATAAEGDPLTFQVNLSNPSGQAITLRLATTDVSATGGLDFGAGNFLVSNDGFAFVPAANGTDVTFAPGQTQLYVRVAGIEDATVEPNETFTLRVASVLAGTVGNSADTGTGTILDDDAPQWFLTGATMVDEGADAGYTLGLTQLGLQPGQTRSIDIALDFPAVIGKLPASAADFQIAVNTLFAELQEAIAAAGQGANIALAALANGVRVTFNSSAPATLPFNHSIAADGLVEGGEAYRLTIANPLNSAGAVAAPIVAGADTVTTMIVDRDMGKWELVGDAQVVEGTLGKAEYRLDLKNADLVQGQSASVVLKAVFGAGAGFATPANAANNNPDRDFAENFLKDLQDALGGAPGVSLTDLGGNMVRVTFTDTSAQTFTFSLPTLDDAIAELNESYRLEIADPSANSMINPALAAVTTLIVDNDRPQWLLVGDTMVSEGGQPLYAINYVGPPILPGQPVSIKLDIELPAGLGGADAADFLESFVKDIQDSVAGQPGKSFDPATRTLTFDSTATTQLLFALPTFDDALYEGTESFTVKILNQSVGDIVPGKDAVVTAIKDNDLPPGPREIALTGDTSVVEGMAGGYTVTLSGPPLAPGQTQSVDIKIVAPGGAGLAAPADFVEGFLKDLQDSLGATPGLVIADQGGGVVRLTFAGTTPPALNFTLPTLDDALAEGNEIYAVMIQNPLGGAAIAPAKDMVTTAIVDNDQPGAPVWAIAGTSSVVEGGQPMYTVVRAGDAIGAGQSQSVDVTVKLPGLLPGAEKADFVNAFLADLQAAAAAVPGSSVALVQDLPDAVTARLTFANAPPTPAPAQFSFKLPTLDDAIYEDTEAYAVTLSNPSAGTVNPGEAAVETRILDNDALVWTIGGGGAVPEGNAASFTVSINRAAEGPVSIRLAPVLPGDVGGAEAADFVQAFTADVTDAVLALGPGAGVSFEPLSATLTFAPGTQLFTFALPTLQDVKAEGNEAFAVKILNPDAGTVAADVANAVILDDDAPGGRNWALSGDNAVAEGGAAKYLLTLDGPVLPPGEARFVEIKLTTLGLASPATLPGNPNADLVSPLLADLQAAAAATTGVTIADLGAGVVRVTFTGTNAPFAFQLPTVQDALLELNESYAVMLQNPQAGTALAPDKGMVATTIVDDDVPGGPVIWQIGGTDQVLEGGVPSYTIVRNGPAIPAGQQNFLDVKIALPGGAGGAEAADFLEAFLKDIQDSLPPGISAAAIPNGVRLAYESTAPKTFAFTLPTFDDTTFEGIEAYTVSIVNQSAGTILPDRGAVETKILDNDAAAPQWAIKGDASVIEGTPNAAQYTIALANAQAGQSYGIDLGFGTVTPGFSFADFVNPNVLQAIAAQLPAGATLDTGTGRLTFAPGTTGVTFALPTFDDAIVEGPESYSVFLNGGTNGSSAMPGMDSASTVIIDNDLPPGRIAWQIEGTPQVTEGATPGYTVGYLGGPIVAPVSIQLDQVFGEGFGGADIEDFVDLFDKDVQDAIALLPPGSGIAYDAATNRLTFQPGAATSFTFGLPTLQDAFKEGTESYAIQIQDPSAGGTIVAGRDNALTTIVDDDSIVAPERLWSITGDYSRLEGQTFAYTVKLTGTALAAGETASVQIAPNFPGGPNGASLSDFAIAAFGDRIAAAVAALPPGSGVAYNPATGTLTFSGGGVSALNFTLPTLVDAAAEGDEVYAINLFNPVNSQTLAIDNAVFSVIVDDDFPPAAVEWKLSGSVLVSEGETPTYTVSWNGPALAPGQTASVRLNLNAPGGDFGALPADFVESFVKDIQDAIAALPLGSGISFDAGTQVLTFSSTAAKQFTFALPTLDDAAVEFTESYVVSLSNQNIGAIVDTLGAVVTRIVDNDSIPNVRIGDAQALEGDKLVFDVTLTAPAPGPITLRLGTTDGTATGGADYETGAFEYSTDGGLTYLPAGGPNGRDVVIPAGATGIKVRIDSIEDATDESNETFTLRVDSVPLGTVGDISDTGTGTILDDDARPRVLIGDASASEGDPLVFDVTLTNPSAGAIVVDLATTNGTATGGVDFETAQFEVSTDGGLTFVPAGGANGTQVTFAPGQTALKVRIASFEDNAVEPDETFTLRVGALVAGDADVTDTGTGRIRNDEFRPVDAKDDKDMVRIGGAPTKGNVVAGTDPDADPVNQGMQVQDDLGANPAATVTLLKYVDANGNPQTVGVPANGQVTVTTYVGGTLTIESDGDYTYTAPAALGNAVAIGVPAGANSAGAGLAQWQNWLTPQSGNAGDPLSKAYTVSIAPEGGALAVKSVSVPNGGPTYTGVGIVGAAGDEAEIDRFGPAEALKIDFNGVCMTSATVGLAALFDGVRFDNGNLEVARIEAVNSMTGQTVATVLVNGTLNGLAEATIAAPPGEVFDLIRLVPVDNAAAQQPNNSDFLLQYVRADRAQIEDKFTYTIQGTGDGSTDSADLTIKIKPPAGGKLLISDAQAGEGDKLVFDLTLSEPANGAVTLRLGTLDGSATGGADYETGQFEYSTDGGATWLPAGGPNGRDVIVPNGAGAIKVRIDSLEDGTDEPDETFTLRVDQVVAGTVADFSDTGTGTIRDDDGRHLCAKDDTDMARAGGTATAGNVVTGVDPDGSPVNRMALMADDLGVNGAARVFEIGYRDVNGKPAWAAVPANGSVTVTTVLGGKLTIESDGDYSYAPPPAHAANDIFVGLPKGLSGAGADLAQWQAWLQPQSGDAGDALARAYTVAIGTDGGQLAVKSVRVPGGPTYTGVGVADGKGDEREIDQCPWESITIDFRGVCMTSAKLGVAALFDGVKFDDGNVEIMRWEAWDSATSTLVATGDVFGTRDGLAEAHVAAPPGGTFDHIRVYAVDNGAHKDADNSDFLIQYVRAEDAALVDTFTYRIEGNVDGATDEATLAIKIKPPEGPPPPHPTPIDDSCEPPKDDCRDDRDDKDGSREAPTAGRDVIVGGDADDLLFGDRVALDPATRAAFDVHGESDAIRAGAGDDIVYGQGGDDTIRGGKGDDTLIGGAGRDTLHGGSGDDRFVGLDAGDVLRGGSGHDTLVLDGAGVYDLRGLGGASLRGIDRVDMTGGGNAELKLTYADLVGMSDSGKLTVNGSAGDKVTADLSGHAVQVQNNGSVTIYVIDGGTATLTVDNQMQHNVIGI